MLQDLMLVVGAAILRAGKCLVARRGPQMRAAGKWEFPGGKVEAGETPQRALAREVAEELEVAISVGRWLGSGVGKDIVLDVYLAEIEVGEPRAVEHAELRWLGADELSGLDWAAPDVPIVIVLAELLKKDSSLA